MKLAIMQPYFFPYIGYFQLVNSVDKFVFYDDVNFIKNGWINRNRILINGNASYITIQLNNASPNKLIKDVSFIDNRNKLKKSIEITYKKSPYFNNCWPVIESCLDYDTNLLSELAIETVKKISEYLKIDTIFEVSSRSYPETFGLERADRLVKICIANNTDTYINPIGGTELYTVEYFKKHNICLKFLQTLDVSYYQNNSDFIPGLSIIDVLMFNSVEEIGKKLKNFKLI